MLPQLPRSLYAWVMVTSKILQPYRVLTLFPRWDQASKPSELIQIRGHEALTLNARRAITILWHHAHRQGIQEGKDYVIEIEHLVSANHKGYEPVARAIEQLMTTLIVLRLPDGSTTRVQFLGGNNMDSKNRTAGILTYSFDRRLIEILQDSTIWGKISVPELMAFSTKYTISLYEHLSQWIGLHQKTSHTFTVSEFREILGVESHKYEKFGDFNHHVIKPIVRETNALAPFNVVIVPRKTGKKVTDICLSWWSKSTEERKAAFDEIQRSRVGRKARISGQVEMVFPAMPGDKRLQRRLDQEKPGDNLIED